MSQDYHNDTMSWSSESVRSAGKNTAGASGSGRENARRQRKKQEKRKRVLLYLLCVLVVSTILAEVGWLWANDLCAFNKEYKEATVEIVKSDSLGDVTDKLKDAGLIQYKWLFRLFSGVMKADTKIGVGTYTLNTEMDYKSLINHMRNRNASLKADVVKVTIPEGYTVSEVIRRLSDYGVSNEEALTEVVKNHVFEEYTFVDNQNLGQLSRLEGYLFPDTYEFFVGEDAVKAISRMLANFQSKVDGELLTSIEESGHSLKEIIIIASLIEKETDGKDRSNISSVIYNRLNNPSYETGGLLQIDASTLYSSDTAYNLYETPGLPPTAISNPGLESIQAAVSPANTGYYYYALGTDGVHHYFKTYNEHVNFLNSSQYAGKQERTQ